MNIELRSEQPLTANHHNTPQEQWNQGTIETLWARWSGQDLPMMRATLNPRCEMSAMNHALQSILRYKAVDAAALAGLPLQRFLPDCGALFSAELWTDGFLYRTLKWQRADGAMVNIRMLLMRATDPSTGRIALIGVGAPLPERQMTAPLHPSYATH